MSCTIVYVNSSHENLRYVKEAAVSAASFRRFFPSAEFVLFTDATYSNPVFDRVAHVEFVVPEHLADTAHKNGQMVAKLNVLPLIDSERVMYLGSDTHALRPEAGTLFDLLDRFDIAAAHAPHRINTSLGNSPIPDVPVCFPEFNCDLVLWRRHDATIRFLQDWQRMYMEHALGHAHDQGPFRLLAYERSDLRIATLPPEYNYRGRKFWRDTVILQNRDELPKYTGGRPGREAPLPLPARVINRGLRKVGVPLQLSRR